MRKTCAVLAFLLIPTLLSAGPIDLKKIDVCTLIPTPELESVIGKIRPPAKPTTSIGEEKGCHFRNDKGRFFEVTIYPLQEWKMVTHTLKDPKPLANVGDGAYTALYSDSLWLEALVKDRAVLAVRVSTKKLEDATALYQLAVKHLP